MSETKPRCEGCGAELKCPGCDDTRPTADDVYRGWMLLTPFGRWEEITKTEQANQYAPVYIWTKQTGEKRPFRYWRWTKVDARRPLETYAGDPEVRVIEQEWRDGAMYAVATHSRSGRGIPGGSDGGVLVEARDAGRGQGWTVTHHPSPDSDDPEAIRCESKAKARSEVRRLGRQYAKDMGVKFRLPDAG